MLRSLQAEVAEGPIARARALVDFLRLTMAFGDLEMVRVLYLSASAYLLLDEVVSTGSPAGAHFPHWKILSCAVRLNAAGLILAHNHPSGNPAPSRADIASTRKLVSGATALDIQIHDHLIVARCGWTSFRALGLLEAA